MTTIETQKLADSFNKDGYLVLKNFFSAEEMPPLLEAIKNAKCAEDSALGLSKGSMVFRSNVFYKDKYIQRFISQQKIIDLLKTIAGKDIWARWDQAVGKGPNSGVFPWHQDNGYNQLEHQHYQLWVAITQSNSENGTIKLCPGSHTSGIFQHKFDGAHLYYDGDVSNSIMLVAEPGDAILFSSYLLHATVANTTKNDTRWAYVIEYMSLDNFDHTVKSPYFVVAKDGLSTQKFIYIHPSITFKDIKKISVSKFNSAKRKLKKLLPSN